MNKSDITLESGLSPDQLSEAASAAKEKARTALNQSEQYVRDNPGPSVLAAFVVGLLIGLLLGKHESRPTTWRDGIGDWWGTCSGKLPSAKDLSKAVGLQESSLRRGADKLRKKFNVW
jgi:hypothetical protein